MAMPPLIVAEREIMSDDDYRSLLAAALVFGGFLLIGFIGHILYGDKDKQK